MIKVTDYSSIQDALNAANTGGIVFFPANTYNVDATLHPGPNTRIEGEGPATVLRVTADCAIQIDEPGVSIAGLAFAHEGTGTHKDCIRVTGPRDYHFERLWFTSSARSSRPYLDRAILTTGAPINLTIRDCIADGLHFEPLLKGGACHRYSGILVKNTAWWGFDLTSAGVDSVVENVLASDIQIMNPQKGGLYLGARQHGYAPPPKRYEMVHVIGCQVGGNWPGDANGIPKGVACSMGPAIVMEDVAVEGLQACGAGGLGGVVGVKLERPDDVAGVTPAFTRCRIDARQVSAFPTLIKRAHPYPGCEILEPN